LVLRLPSNTSNSTSLGTVPNAATTLARETFLASTSAPEEVRATTSLVLAAFIGSEHVTMTLPDRSPARAAGALPEAEGRAVARVAATFSLRSRAHS